MKSFRHIERALVAAAVFGLLAAIGVSCGDRRKATGLETASSADTQALVEELRLSEGLRLFEEAEYELAREQLLLSAQSTSAHIRAESFLYLNAAEMELGNYEAARPWLEKYHAETVRLLRSAAEASELAAKQAAALRRRNDMLAGGMIVVVLLIAGAVVFFTRSARRRSPHVAEGFEAQTNSSRQERIPHDASEWDGWRDDAEAFKQRAVWVEIAALAEQKPGREARVLTSARQEVLDGELSEAFSGLEATIRDGYPALTAGDIKLCCLSLLPISSFGRALCYGSTETNIVKQRKHTIKKKLADDPRGRALFEFIFDKRQ